MLAGLKVDGHMILFAGGRAPIMGRGKGGVGETM